MRWTIAVLLVVGLIAAFCAALLVGGLRASNALGDSAAAPKEVTVAVARRDLAAMTPVPADAITVKTVARELAPNQPLSDPLQIVGKVLVVPMLEGQVFTSSSFPTHRQGVELAASLPAGTRAVSVSLSDYGGLAGLLYPGCRVDVLAAFSLPGGSQEIGKAISTTLLQSIQVLAIEDESVVAQKNTMPDDDSAGPSVADATRRSATTVSTRPRQLKVTLAVDPRQAAALQLAMEFGSISLAMRNPLDNEEVEQDPTLLSGGQLAKLASFLEARIPSQPDDAAITEQATVVADAAAATPRPAADTAQPQQHPQPQPQQQAPPSRPQWEVTILRGVKAEQLSLPMPDSR